YKRIIVHKESQTLACRRALFLVIEHRRSALHHNLPRRRFVFGMIGRGAPPGLSNPNVAIRGHALDLGTRWRAARRKKDVQPVSPHRGGLRLELHIAAITGLVSRFK